LFCSPIETLRKSLLANINRSGCIERRFGTGVYDVDVRKALLS